MLFREDSWKGCEERQKPGLCVRRLVRGTARETRAHKEKMGFALFCSGGKDHLLYTEDGQQLPTVGSGFAVTGRGSTRGPCWDLTCQRGRSIKPQQGTATFNPCSVSRRNNYPFNEIVCFSFPESLVGTHTGPRHHGFPSLNNLEKPFLSILFLFLLMTSLTLWASFSEVSFWQSGCLPARLLAMPTNWHSFFSLLGRH